MKLTQSFLSNFARTQRQLVAPDPGDETVSIPPLFMPASSLPAVLDAIFSPGTAAEPHRVSFAHAIGQAFGVAGFDLPFVFIDKGLWEFSWTMTQVCTTAGTISNFSGLYFLSNKPPGPFVTIGAFGQQLGNQTISGQFKWALDEGGVFRINIPPHATAVGFLNVTLQGNKLL